MSLPKIVGAFAVLLAVAGCASPRFDPVVEAQKLLQRDAEWSRDASAGKDVEKTVGYWSDDALVIPQGETLVEGKAGIRSFVARSFQAPGFHIEWKSEKVVFSPDGKMAYMRSTSTTTVPRRDGTLVTLPGRGITIWRLDPDGQWRCVVDIWNDPPRALAVGE